MDQGAAVTFFNIASFLFGLYLMLTSERGPKPERRFFIGALCALGGAAIAAYRYSQL